MASFNKTVIVGRLGQDPEVKQTPGGTSVCEISLAVDRQWKDKHSGESKKETDWIPVTLWGRTAEICGEYMRKGSQILIEGRLQMDSWLDRESGQKRSKLKVIGENMTMLGSGGQQGGGERQQQRDEPKPQESPNSFDEPVYSGPVDDVPF